MDIIDTYSSALTSYGDNGFSFERWEKYIGSALPGLMPILVSDVKEVLQTGGFSKEDYLSVLNLVPKRSSLIETAHRSFLQVTKNMESVIYERFGKSLDVSVVFYLGLCNGAGWVTEYRGRTAILLGMEKIAELNWCSVDDMRGLVCHELGHVYQKQYGTLKREFDRDEDTLLWQLFTEGVAMCFEQIVVGDPDYFHQEKDGWKQWCDEHCRRIKRDFAEDLKTLPIAKQRYFGDWVSYIGRGDVGYYLGSRFVRYIMTIYGFDEIISFEIGQVKAMFNHFTEDI